MKKKIVGILICTLLIATVIPSISGNIDENIGIETIMSTSQTDDNSAISSANVNWWPMFRHDLGHSGHSTSDAPDTNNVLWSYTTGGRVWSSPAVSDGKVYIGSLDKKVYCLNADNGNKIWSYTTGERVDSSPAISNGKVYFGSDDYNVYCLDAYNGNKIWSYTTGNWVGSSPAIWDGKVYIGSYDHEVYCLDADNGNKIWNYTTGERVGSSPAVSDGKVYIGSLDKKVYCLNAYNGNKIWSYNTAGYVYSSPAVSDGKVYIGSGEYDGNVYCLNADNGNNIWSYYTTVHGVGASPAVSYDKVYIGGAHKMYCLNAYNGNEIWNYTGCAGHSSPAVSNGKVYIGSYDHEVYCLDADNGNNIWSYNTAGYVDSSPAVSDGKVYIGSYSDGKVYCFSDGGNQPPTVQITSPTSGATVLGAITIQGTASDSDGTVTQVEVRIDGGIWQTCSGTTSWSIGWDTTTVSDGAHTIDARSKDNDGAYSTVDSIPVTVSNGGNNPPTVHITSPTFGAIVSGTINIQGTASDSDGTVTQVEVMISGAWQTCSGTTSWSTSWDTTTVSDGDVVIDARSKDNDGAYSTVDSIIVTVNNGANTPPTVHIHSPPDGATVLGTINIHGGASDPGGLVAQVQVKIGSGGTWWTAILRWPLWGIDWDTTSVIDGSHTIYARSQDNDGAYSTEDSVTVTVNNGVTNNPPNQPTTPTGQSSSCKVNTPYPYSTSAADSDPGDKVEYGWDWTGDSVVDLWDDNGGSYYTPGTPITTQITWTSKQTTYTLKAIAQDLNGAQSPWSLPLSVTTPKNKPYINTPFLQFLQNFFESYPNAFPMLQHILQL